MKKRLLLSIFSIFLFTKINAQNYWTEFTASKNSLVTHKAVARQSFPSEFKLFQLNADALKSEMYRICDATMDSKKPTSTIITLPNAKGELEQFRIYEASNFDEQLQARFPEIRAFSGQSLVDGSSLKIAISPINISSTVFRNNAPTEIIEQYSDDARVYSVYDRSKTSKSSNWKCSTVDNIVERENEILDSSTNKPAVNTGIRKVMRLAQSCNAEYSNYFGATSVAQVANVVTAFNNTLTRCNGVYEKDLGLHLNLINESTNVIYYTAATDPYTTDDCAGSGLGNWNTELQNALNTTLTGVGSTLAANNAAYDIGHMFGRCGGGGNAGCIGCPCVPGVAGGNDATSDTKGQGITSPADGIPLGDNFDIDYVVHEIGHQLGANHTFSFANHGQPYEVGSGITIMGYAGITGADVVPHSIDAYHATSINEIQSDADFASCGVNNNITANNAVPTVTITGTALTIPISTPFALDCTGADTNGTDVLTYSWEQFDPRTGTFSNATSNATATKTSGPNFISFAPTTNTTRYFPRMASLLTNALSTGWVITPCTTCNAGYNSEFLPSVARTMNFRVTVRDNAPYTTSAPLSMPQTNFANMTVTTNATGGAFTVSSQGAAGISYIGGSAQTITWNAGSTAGAPFNATNVDVLISYNSGATWTVILAGTPNDGTQLVTLPNPATDQTNCRIMVRSAVTGTQRSYFFDLNNNAFTITHSLNTASFEYQNLELFPNPTNGTLNVKFTAATNDDITLKVHDLRGRLVFNKSFANNGTFDQSINLDNVQAGTYLVSILEGENKVVKRIIIE